MAVEELNDQILGGGAYRAVMGNLRSSSNSALSFLAAASKISLRVVMTSHDIVRERWAGQPERAVTTSSRIGAVSFRR